MRTRLTFLLHNALRRKSVGLKTLQNAIAERQIVPFYHPFVDADTGLLAGIEVLARWKHPLYGFISPDVFIPMAEKHELIVSLTHQLLQQVIDDSQHSLRGLPSGIYICFNISAQNCLDPQFEEKVSGLSKIFLARQSQVVIEITERHPLHFTPELMTWFAALRRSNIAVALDDFGTGYSNLGYISALNPEFIKIDKMFTSQIGMNNDTRLVDGLISLAHHMQVKVIAEGVETEEQAEYLRARKVEYLQGYYFSQPLSGADLTGKIEK